MIKLLDFQANLAVIAVKLIVPARELDIYIYIYAFFFFHLIGKYNCARVLVAPICHVAILSCLLS
jgi:hypothetical protein